MAREMFVRPRNSRARATASLFLAHFGWSEAVFGPFSAYFSLFPGNLGLNLGLFRGSGPGFWPFWSYFGWSEAGFWPFWAYFRAVGLFSGD